MFRRYNNRNYFFDSAAFAVLIAVIYAVIASIVIVIQTSIDQSSGERNINLMRALYSLDEQQPDSEQAIAARKKAAAVLSAANALGNSNNTNVGPFTDFRNKELFVVLEATAGKKASLDTYVPTYGSRFMFFLLYPIGLIYWVIAGLVVLLTGMEGPRYGLDAPWRSPLMWPFALLFGPLAWIVFFGGWLKYRKNSVWRPRVAPVVPAAEQRGYDPDFDYLRGVGGNIYGNYDEENPPSYDVDTRQATTQHYVSAPKSGLAVFTDLRVTRATEIARERVREVDSEIEVRTDKLQELADKIRKNQAKLNAARATKRDYEQNGLEVDVTPAVAASEFERIMQLPGVLAVQVIDNNLQFIVRGVITYGGNRYDAGDWRVSLNEAISEVTIGAYEIRSGVRDSWQGDYPVYRLGRGLFCFGNREYIIREHLSRGQYLEALSLAIECINSVNREDASSVPAAFYQIKEEVHA